MKLEKLLIRRLKKLAMFADMNGFALVADAAYWCHCMKVVAAGSCRALCNLGLKAHQPR